MDDFDVVQLCFLRRSYKYEICLRVGCFV